MHIYYKVTRVSGYTTCKMHTHKLPVQHWLVMHLLWYLWGFLGSLGPQVRQKLRPAEHNFALRATAPELWQTHSSYPAAAQCC